MILFSTWIANKPRSDDKMAKKEADLSSAVAVANCVKVNFEVSKILLFLEIPARMRTMK